MVKTLQRKFLAASMLAVTILLVTLVGLINILYCYSVYTREKSMLEMLCETDGRPEGPPDLPDSLTGTGTEGAGPGENAGNGSNADGYAGNGDNADSNSGNDNKLSAAEGAEASDVPDRADMKPGDLRGERSNREYNGGFLQRGMSMDEALSARFFAVWFDEEGQIVLTDTSQIYAVSGEGAQEMAQAILALGKSTGVYQGFRYMLAERDSFRPEDLQEKGASADGQDDLSAGDDAGTGRPALSSQAGTAQSAQDLQNGTGAQDAQDLQNGTGAQDAQNLQNAQIAQSADLESNAHKILVAMDISADRADMLRILGISVLIAALCWAAMLLPVHALAKRAIAPTAMSIERQKQFVTNAGHELKTPLAIIQANTDALELYTGESKWTRNIRAQTIRLNGLMQNLLTLSRMDENSLKLEKKPFVLNPLVGEVWEDFAEPAAGRKLSVQIGTEQEEELKVLANRESIAQLLSILFDNAVKYTPRGGQIEVKISAAADTVKLIQSNTVSEEKEQNILTEDPNRLFERFYRTDSDRSRKKGGYGIGLSAARAIAGANDGSIRADAEDGRIVFTVTLKRVSG